MSLLIDAPVRTCSCCQMPITHWTPMGECDRCIGQAHAISLCAESYRFIIGTAATVTTARQLLLTAVASWFAIYPSPAQIAQTIARIEALRPGQMIADDSNGRYLICQHRYGYETISLAGYLGRMVYWLTPTRTAVHKTDDIRHAPH